MTKISSKEKQVAGFSYIINFYEEVQILSNNFSVYNNLVLEMKEKYKGDNNMDDMEEAEVQSVRNVLNHVRASVNKTFIMYKSIVESIENFSVDQELQKLKESMNSEYTIKRDELERYVNKINNFLTMSVIQDLLQTSQNIFSDVYKDGQENERERG